MFGSVTRGRPRYSEAQLRVNATVYVSATLAKYEAMSDDQLAKGRIGVKLEDSGFMHQVTLAATDNPAVRQRWEALNQRAWGAEPLVDRDDSRGRNLAFGWNWLWFVPVVLWALSAIVWRNMSTSYG